MSSNFATMATVVWLLVSATRNESHASGIDLSKEIELALASEADHADDTASNDVIYNPPKLDGTYDFLAYTALENPFPNNASYSHLTTLSKRANQVCVNLGNTSAISVIVENHFNLEGLEFAFVYEGVAFVDLYKPLTFSRPGIGNMLVPTASFKKLVCKTN